MQKLTLRLFDYLKIKDVYVQIKLYAFRDTLSERNFGLLQKKCSSKKKQGTGEIKVRFIYSFILFYLCIYLFCLQKYACVIFYANKKHTIILIDLEL